jgi:hypothetical protein
MTKITKKIFSVATTFTLLLGSATPVLADTITINGNGADANNVVNTTSTNTTTVQQTNEANVVNNVVVKTTTGGNELQKNTGGDMMLKTGDATSQVNVSNTLNNNEATLNCCAQSNLTVDVSGNGVGGDREKDPNTVNVTQTTNTTVVQDNVSNVKNMVSADAKTGGNEAEKNTGGNLTVQTGDAESNVVVSTTANSNKVAVVSPLTLSMGGVSAKISGNGADSNNAINLTLNKSLTLTQDNKAKVDNMIHSSATSGDNEADKNTGGNVEIKTGDASTMVGVENKLNFNHADVDCCLAFSVDAQIGPENGSGSDNEINLTLLDKRYVGQENLADVKNMVEAKAGTGYNEAEKNTGGNSIINTGDAQMLVGVENMLNFNHANVDCCLSSLDALIKKNGADSDNAINATRMFDQLTLQNNGAKLANMVGGEKSGATSGGNEVEENTGDPSGDPAIYTGDTVGVVAVSNAVNTNDVTKVPSVTLPGFDYEFQFVWNWSLFWNHMFGWL